MTLYPPCITMPPNRDISVQLKRHTEERVAQFQENEKYTPSYCKPLVMTMLLLT
jgi:hypothetical protein